MIETLTMIILSLGTLVFFISSIVFAKMDWRQANHFNSALIVSATTAVSYAVMLAIYLGTPTTDSLSTRWLFYIISCSLLIYHIAKVLRLNNNQRISAGYLMALIMITGFVAAEVSDLWFVLVIYLIGSAFYVLALKIIWQGTAHALAKLKPYLIYGWTGFPIVFLLSPAAFDLISLDSALALYLGLDIYTKIVFYKDYNQLVR